MIQSLIKKILVFVLLAVIARDQLLNSKPKFGDQMMDEHRDHLVIWNVGQGLWTTWRTKYFCWHFDMGGEKAPWSLIEQFCQNKYNLVSLSHWDFDHIRFASQARSRLQNFCVMHEPEGPPSALGRSQFQTLPHCHRLDLQKKLPIHFEQVVQINIKKPNPDKIKDRNSFSRVFVLLNTILLPGDSPKTQEKDWSHKMDLSQIQWLLLGHHGSRTSTSYELLKQLPSLKQSIASARQKKYGHPHVETVKKVKKVGATLIRNEDWGSLIFELPFHRSK